MFFLLKDVYRHLSTRRRVQLGAVLALMLAGAVAELVTLGAVLPFLGLLADPSLSQAGPVVRAVLTQVGDWLNVPPLLAAALLFGGMALVAGMVRLLLTWASYRFVFMVGADLGCDIYSRILQQPYAYHLQHNSSEALASKDKVNLLVMGTLASAMQLVIAGFMSLFIFVGLLLIDAMVALTAGGLFATMYWASSRYARRRLAINSQIIAEADVQKNKAMQEGLGAIRDVILDNSHDNYVAQFAKADLAQRKAQAVNMVLAGAPKYVIESVGLILIVALAYLLAHGPQGAAAALPVLGALALGAQKLLPYMQNIYNAVATIRGTQVGASGAVTLLQLAVPEHSTPVPRCISADVPPRIAFRNVEFRYGPHIPPVFQDLSLEILPGQRVGLVGATGSGKSTLIDLLMGLLTPTCGTLLIDDVVLTPNNMGAWRARIAHVPQSVYLSDTSVLENIALGVPQDQIDMLRVERAVVQAQLKEVIEQLPNGLHTRVGERGVQLSGGQRQRIGIARALYKEADVLVLDEATSALDNETETRVMDAIYQLNPQMIIVMIAHRLSSIDRCSHVYKVTRNGVLLRD